MEPAVVASATSAAIAELTEKVVSDPNLYHHLNKHKKWHLDCLLSVFRGLRNGILTGVRIRIPYIFQAVIYAAIFRDPKLLSRVKFVIKQMFYHGRNLGLFVGIYKGICCIFRNFGIKGGIESLIAGFIGGYFAFGDSKSTSGSVNNQIVLYLFARSLIGFIQSMVKRKIIPETLSTTTPKGFRIFAGVTLAMILYLTEYEPDTLNTSFMGTMTYLYHKSDSGPLLPKEDQKFTPIIFIIILSIFDSFFPSLSLERIFTKIKLFFLIFEILFAYLYTTMLKRIGLLFPGQGSQSIGMGKELVHSFPYIKNVYTRADSVLKFPLSDMMFNGVEEELKQTENTQPALLLHSYSILKILENELGFNSVKDQVSADVPLSKEFIKRFDCYMGHSLGEFTALLATNALSFEDAIKLVRYRGLLMKESPNGRMDAVISRSPINIHQIRELVDKVNSDVSTKRDKYNVHENSCSLSSINSPNQVVISGTNSGVGKVIDQLKTLKLTTRRLKVSAAFHSPLMEQCREEFSKTLNNTHFNLPQSTIFSNVTSKKYPNEINEIKNLLSKQLTSTVEWLSSIENCNQELVQRSKSNSSQEEIGNYCFVEVGNGDVLSKLLQQTIPNINSRNLESPTQIYQFLKEFKDLK
eukprot:gene7901-9721_t